QRSRREKLPLMRLPREGDFFSLQILTTGSFRAGHDSTDRGLAKTHETGDPIRPRGVGRRPQEKNRKRIKCQSNSFKPAPDEAALPFANRVPDGSHRSNWVRPVSTPKSPIENQNNFTRQPKAGPAAKRHVNPRPQGNIPEGRHRDAQSWSEGMNSGNADILAHCSCAPGHN